MDALFAIAQDAPLSTVLVLGGFLFLILALGGRLKGGLEIPTDRQKWSAVIGSVLVCGGVFLYFASTTPDGGPPSQPPTENTPPPTSASTKTSEPEMHRDSFIEMAGGWPIVFADTFDDDKGVWWTGNTKDEWLREKRRIADGHYIWEITALQDDLFAWHAPTSLQAVSDFYVTVKGQYSGATAFPPTYGVIFRQTGDDFYAFTIREDGYFRCRLRQGGTWTSLLDWQSTPAIRPGTFNEITVVGPGPYFGFAVNGHTVESLNHSSLESGHVGFIVTLGKAGDSAVFSFDDFELR